MTLILTTVLVLNCFFLVLLILIQLPKKESGSGLAFGGGTLDMALGAGAGNVLTKLTKVSASLFLLLCLVLAVIGGTDKGGLSERLAGDGAPAAANPPANPPANQPASHPAIQPLSQPDDQPKALVFRIHLARKTSHSTGGAGLLAGKHLPTWSNLDQYNYIITFD